MTKILVAEWIFHQMMT
jgi:predicted DNA-binding ArsR family transcriptional regulator